MARISYFLPDLDDADDLEDGAPASDTPPRASSGFSGTCPSCGYSEPQRVAAAPAIARTGDGDHPSAVAWRAYRDRLSSAYLGGNATPAVGDAQKPPFHVGPLPGPVTAAGIQQSQQRCVEAYAKYVDGLSNAYKEVVSL